MPDQFIYATRQILAMHQVRQHPILILLIGFVLFAPLFEFFDNSQDVDEGTDLVLVLLSAFVSTGLFVICKSIAYFFVRLFFVQTIPADALVPLSNPSVRVDGSPPECFMLLGSLRI